MILKQHIPNALTLLRYLLVPALIGSWYCTGEDAAWLPFVLFMLAGITDYFDGYLARKWMVESELGRMLDPNADKLLVAAALVLLATSGEASAIAVIVILCRELFVSGLREFMAARTITIHVSALAKWKTASQMLAITVLLYCHANPDLEPLGGHVLLWISALLTVITGADYLRGALRELSKDSRS